MTRGPWTGSNLTVCKHCGARVFVATDEHGTPIPLDYGSDRIAWVVSSDMQLCAVRTVATAHHVTCKGSRQREGRSGSREDVTTDPASDAAEVYRVSLPPVRRDLDQPQPRPLFEDV